MTTLPNIHYEFTSTEPTGHKQYGKINSDLWQVKH